MTRTFATAFIYILWVLLVIYLAVAAWRAKRDTQPHLLQRLLLLLAIIAAFALPCLPAFRFLAIVPGNPVLRVIGVTVAMIGAIFFVWARQSLGRNWSQTVSAKEEHDLVTSGSYRYIRHPMYAAGLVMCLGSALAVAGGFIFLLLLLTPLFLWRVRAEDRLLAQQFPQQFPAYRWRTKTLVPFIW